MLRSLFHTAIISNETCTYARTCMQHPGCFPGWSMCLLAFASHLFVLLSIICSVSFFLVSEPGGRNRPPCEAPCKQYQHTGTAATNRHTQPSQSHTDTHAHGQYTFHRAGHLASSPHSVARPLAKLRI